MPVGQLRPNDPDRSITSPGWIFHGVIVMLLSLDACAMFIHFIRISATDQIGHIYKFSTGVAIFISAIAGIGYGFRPTMSSFFFVGLLLHGLCGTVLHNYNADYHFWGHIYYWAIMFFGFHLGQSTQIDLKRCEKILIWLARLILIGSALGFMNLESYRSAQQGSIYNGYAGDQLLFPLAVFVNYGMSFHSFAALALIVLSTRRGPMLAALFAVVMVVFAKRMRHLWMACVATVVPLAIAGAVCFVVIRYIATSDTFSESSAVSRVAQKWNKFFDYQENATEATSGRDIEVEGTLALMQEGKLDWLTGHGFGWVNEATDWHFCHVSYLNNLVTHGLILGSIQIAFILFQVNRTHRRAQLGGPESRLLWTAMTYQIAVLVLSFTAAWIAISFMFWLMLGLGSRSRISNPLPQLK